MLTEESSIVLCKGGSDHKACYMSECMQFEVNEEFVRYFVQQVLFAETPDQPEQEAEPEDSESALQQSRLHDALAEV